MAGGGGGGGEGGGRHTSAAADPRSSVAAAAAAAALPVSKAASASTSTTPTSSKPSTPRSPRNNGEVRPQQPQHQQQRKPSRYAPGPAGGSDMVSEMGDIDHMMDDDDDEGRFTIDGEVDRRPWDINTMMVTGGSAGRLRARAGDYAPSSAGSYSDKALDASPVVCGVCAEAIPEPDAHAFYPCECAFRICRDCQDGRKTNAVTNTNTTNNKDKDGVLRHCPGCGQPYAEQIARRERAREDDYVAHGTPRSFTTNTYYAPSSTGAHSDAEHVRRYVRGGLLGHDNNTNTTNNKDMSPALAAEDTSGSLVSVASYGYGSVYEVPGEGKDGVKQPVLAPTPLYRKIAMPSRYIQPYRALCLFRLAATAAFISWRVRNPNPNAYGLWLASVFCEVWFALSWVLDQVPKLRPVKRETYLARLGARYTDSDTDETDKDHLPSVDAFITTADASREPPLITANTILSILAMDYPASKLTIYLSDDGASKFMFDVMAETALFARLWVPFCKRFGDVEPRQPEVYFARPIDYAVTRDNPDFVKARLRMKRAYDEFKLRVAHLAQLTKNPPPDGWKMHDGRAWPGNKRSDHEAIIQVFLPTRPQVTASNPTPDPGVTDVDGNPLPALIYMSREKRPGHYHNKKAGAMNALVRCSALITNGQFIFNVDCDHYINNSRVVREALCFFLDPLKGHRVGYVQFPQKFDGIDKSDRYANNNVVFFDANMRGLDGCQGPLYVGTGCFFRRQALYDRKPPPDPLALERVRERDRSCWAKLCCCCIGDTRRRRSSREHDYEANNNLSMSRSASKMQLMAVDEALTGMQTRMTMDPILDDRVVMDGSAKLLIANPLMRKLGMSSHFVASTLAVDALPAQRLAPRDLLAEVVLAISADYEDSSEWGKRVGWVYGTVTEDVLTGFFLHANGWRSVYHTPELPAFKGTAPTNLTDRLEQVLRWATGSIEIFFSGNNPWVARYGSGLKPAQRIAYMATMFYPFTSLALVMYCVLPAVSLFINQFIVPDIGIEAVVYYACLFLSIIGTSLMEIKWSGVTFDDFWRNEQFWVISGTSAHFAAVYQGLLKNTLGVDIAFSITQKADDAEEEFYLVKWSWLLFVPLTIAIINVLALIAGIAAEVNKQGNPQWGELFGKVIFSLWVLVHYYPFLKGLMGRRSRPPTMVIVWAVLLVLVFSVFWSRAL
eukprot:jgi/Chlat1/1752/Chrsp134S08684